MILDCYPPSYLQLLHFSSAQQVVQSFSLRGTNITTLTLTLQFAYSLLFTFVACVLFKCLIPLNFCFQFWSDIPFAWYDNSNIQQSHFFLTLAVVSFFGISLVRIRSVFQTCDQCEHVSNQIKLPYNLCRCFYLARSYSLAGKRTEAYILYGKARSLADTALKKLQSSNNADEVCRFLIFKILYICFMYCAF